MKTLHSVNTLKHILLKYTSQGFLVHVPHRHNKAFFMCSIGYGGPLKDVPAEKFNCTAMPRSYQSPWEQALISDPSLAETLVARMPEPQTRQEILQYKSFNR